MAGDAIQNMRSALDHLIWALTRLSSTPPNPDQSLKIAFPVCTKKGAYWDPGNGARRRQAGWIGNDALAIVDGLQPYLRGNGANDHPLAVVAAYSNEDKHRNLAVSAVLPVGGSFTFEMGSADRQMILTGFTFTQTGDGRLYNDAHIGVVEFNEGTTCDAVEMVVKPVLTGDVAFGIKGPGLMFNVPTLEKVLDAIYAEVVVPLDEILWRESV
jgi:hypothetical protein